MLFLFFITSSVTTRGFNRKIYLRTCFALMNKQQNVKARSIYKLLGYLVVIIPDIGCLIKLCVIVRVH